VSQGREDTDTGQRLTDIVNNLLSYYLVLTSLLRRLFASNACSFLSLGLGDGIP